MNKQVIAGVAVAPGEVKCGVAISLMEPRQTSNTLVKIGRAIHGDPSSVPLTEEARRLKGMACYLSPDWDIPSCPVIGKGVSDHCKHGIGNLDYCPHCEHEDDDNIDLSDMEI